MYKYFLTNRSNPKERITIERETELEPGQIYEFFRDGYHMPLNTLQLTQILFLMGERQKKYGVGIYQHIINAIIVQYLTNADYMEENAIATFDGFLKYDVLNW